MAHMDVHDNLCRPLDLSSNAPLPLYSSTAVPKDSDLNGRPDLDQPRSPVEELQIQEQNQSESSDLTGEIEVESSRSQIHADNGIVVETMKSSDDIEVESSQTTEEENGIVKPHPEANPCSDIELNGQHEIVEEGKVILEDNHTVSDAIQNCNGDTEIQSFEKEEGIWESQDASLDCVDDDKEKVDEMDMVNSAVINDGPVGGIKDYQNITTGAAKSDLEHPHDSVEEDVKGECKSGVVLNEHNSERTQVTVFQNGEHYFVKGEEQECSENEVSLLEPLEGNKVEMEQHLAAPPSLLVNSEDVNGSISISTKNGLPTSMDQDDLREAIEDNDIVANGTSFHDYAETSSGSVDCDIPTVEAHNLSLSIFISDPKVELNEIAVDELEVNPVLKLEENSETDSHPKVDECDKVEVLECTVSENGDDLPTALDESKFSPVGDSVPKSELIREEIEHVQSIETTVYSVVIGNILIETRDGSSIHSLNGPVLISDLEVEDCTMAENVAYAGDDIQPDKEVRENQEIGLISDNDSETNCENGDIKKDNISTFPGNDVKPNNCTSIESEERGSIVSESPNGVNKSSVIQQSSPVVTDSELHDKECNSSSKVNEKSGCDIEITSSIGSRSIPGDDCNVSKTKVLKGSVVNDEGDLNLMSDVAFETDGKQTKEVTEIVHEGCLNEPSPISPEGSVDALAGQNVGAEAGTRPFNFLVRVPRFDDGNIREQMKCAQIEVDQKTKDRDAIRVQIQTIRAAWKVLSDNVEAAVSEGKAARELLKSKRQEIDSVQSVLTKVKNAMSIEDIDVRIRNIDHMIEHETLPLKEEKQLIREIKQLKQLRDQLLSTMDKQEELQQALNQKDEIEERLKLLRKEMDSLRNNVLKAESVTKAAKKKYNDESIKLDDLQSQFKAADKIRQEAYANLQSMRKQLYEKNKYCWKYRDDIKEANEIASSRDEGRLQRFCIDQVERMMELWNSNSEFRNEYIKSNMRSTLRRLKTLDGRSLGPNEEPHLLNHIVKERPAMENSFSMGSTMREPEKVIPTDNARDHDKAVTKVAETKNQTKKIKKPDTVLALVNGHRDICSENEEEEPPRAEEIKQTREEEELTAEEEELRKEEKAMKLKEQRKLEEKAKAKEALERKKRIAEKAHARAVIKARKEAEKRDKEREKRAKKKERKMGAAETEGGNGGCLEEREPAMITQSESPKAKQGVEMVAGNRPAKVCSQFNTTNKRPSKTKLIPPPPLRNRGAKRRMQPWMWVLLTTLTAVFVFLLFSTRSASSSWLGF